MESQHLEMVNQCPAVSAGEIYQYDGFPGTITKTIYVANCLAGWWYTYSSEKYVFVSWDDDIPNIWKNKKCSKPPNG